ncbi:uncharacterized protein [Osmerus mordax]|uniref:uncharacterized protein n=1 Tax=Osmerus mordax TaxID=8014 RepID=UPI0035107185
MTQETAESEATDKPSVTPGTHVTGTSSTLTSTDEEGSGDLTPDMFTKETSETTVSSLYSTEKPVVTTTSHVTETADSSKTAVTAASSLYSTEKPTTGTHEIDEESSGHQTSDMISQTSSVTPATVSSLFSTEKTTIMVHETSKSDSTEESSSSERPSVTDSSLFLTSTDEEGSGDLTPDMFTKETSETTVSSLYSTEKPPTTMTHETTESEATDKPSVTPGTDVTGTSSTLTYTDEEGSGDLTPDMFTKETSKTTVSSLYSTEKPKAL